MHLMCIRAGERSHMDVRAGAKRSRGVSPWTAGTLFRFGNDLRREHSRIAYQIEVDALRHKRQTRCPL